VNRARDGKTCICCRRCTSSWRHTDRSAGRSFCKDEENKLKFTALATFVYSLRLKLEKVVERRSQLAQRIVGRHESIIHERVHQNALFDDFLKLIALLQQIAIVVVRHDNAIVLDGELQDVAVVVAHHALSIRETSRGSVHEDALLLQFVEDLLVFDRIVGSRAFFSPLGHKDGYILVTPLAKPVHGNGNAATAKHLFVAMTHRNIAAVDDDRPQHILLARHTVVTDLTTFNISSKITC
jgi:hypothetical protein